MQAAWAADDAAAMTEPAELRADVAALWDGHGRRGTGLRRLDVLRRAGQFEARRGLGGGDGRAGAWMRWAAVIGFQRARIAARDIGRHLISSALPPPAMRRMSRTASGPRRGSGRGCCGVTRWVRS